MQNSMMLKAYNIRCYCQLGLQTNISTHYGRVNGAMGIICDVAHGERHKPPNDIPHAVMVDFDKYNGPKFYPTAV